MSAIECKIIICGNEAGNASQTALDVIGDLIDSENEDIAKEVIDAQEDYVKRMHCALGRLTPDA